MNATNLPKPLLDLTVREFLEILGSSSPTPGGGAAAALAGAMGAALVEMTANLTIGRPKFAAVDAEARAIGAAAAVLRRQLAEHVDGDARAYDGVMAAYRLPRATDEEKAARVAAIQAALVGAAEEPLAAARACAAVLPLAERAAPILNPQVVSDVRVGAVLAHAGLEGAAENVDVNLAMMTDDATRLRLAADLSAVRFGAENRLHVVRSGS